MKKQNEDKNPKVQRQDWDSDELAKEATNKEDDEIVRQMLRGDETEGDPDERDVVPSPDFINTPHGRAEVNKQNERKK